MLKAKTMRDQVPKALSLSLSVSHTHIHTHTHTTGDINYGVILNTKEKEILKAKTLRDQVQSALTEMRDLRYSVLQCVAVCCSVLQCVAVCCSVLQCVAVCASVSVCCRNARSQVHSKIKSKMTDMT